MLRGLEVLDEPLLIEVVRSRSEGVGCKSSSYLDGYTLCYFCDLLRDGAGSLEGLCVASGMLDCIIGRGYAKLEAHGGPSRGYKREQKEESQ